MNWAELVKAVVQSHQTNACLNVFLRKHTGCTKETRPRLDAFNCAIAFELGQNSFDRSLGYTRELYNFVNGQR